MYPWFGLSQFRNTDKQLNQWGFTVCCSGFHCPVCTTGLTGWFFPKKTFPKKRVFYTLQCRRAYQGDTGCGHHFLPPQGPSIVHGSIPAPFSAMPTDDLPIFPNTGLEAQQALSVDENKKETCLPNSVESEWIPKVIWQVTWLCSFPREPNKWTKPFYF